MSLTSLGTLEEERSSDEPEWVTEVGDDEGEDREEFPPTTHFEVAGSYTVPAPQSTGLPVLTEERKRNDPTTTPDVLIIEIILLYICFDFP